MLLIAIAFLSGVLTVFSPCVLPILPIILASGIDGKAARIKGVISGLIVSFTLASLLLATVVRLLGIPADLVRLFAVGLLSLFGVSLVFPKIWETTQAFIEKHWHFQPAATKNTNDGFVGGFVTGIGLGIVWTPCIGPVVAAVATLAAVGSFSIQAVFIAFAYALGTGLPLYFIAKGGSKVSSKLQFVKKENQKIRQVFGVIILATALFIWTGADRALQAWTLNHLPDSWTQATTFFEKKFDVDDQLQDLQGKKETSSTKPNGTVVNDVELQNDFTGAKIAHEDLEQGCRGKDCIPALNEPVFEQAAQANTWLKPTDRVFGLDFEGVTKAYPQRIMNWHEIVNDTVHDTPITVTFCPLCGSAVAFERTFNSVTTEFGVSGKLHNNDLVMYDRYEGNLWQQITGEAIVGPAARRNEQLNRVPIITVEWSQWQKEHPETVVLSRETGHARDYDQYPYGTYEQDDRLLFGIKDLNRSLPMKAVVYGVEFGDNAKAYPESTFVKQPTFTDTIGDTIVTVERHNDGAVTVTNQITSEQLPVTRLFWFAWAAFHPNTALYE